MNTWFFYGVKMSLIKNILFILSVLLLTGCMSGKLDDFDNLMAQGKYDEAKKFALDEDSDLLWTLQAGASANAAGEYKESNTLLDKAERKYIDFRRKGTASTGMRKAAQVIANDASVAYEGDVIDGIMTNTYKAINFMFLREWDLARVELNRAYDRQRRAVDYYAKQIAKDQAEARKKGYNIDVEKVLNRPDMKGAQDVEGYGDFVNPLVNLVEVIFLKYRGDGDDAERLRQTRDRLLGMTQSKHLQKELSAEIQYTWVVIENGQMPRRIEWRLDLPVGILSSGIKEMNNLQFISIAIPKLQVVPAAYNQFSVNGENTDMISDMDRVAEAEYSRALPSILLRAGISMMIKTAVQYEVGKNSFWTGLGLGILQAVSTQADIRCWTAIPKNYHLAIIPSGEIKLVSRGITLGQASTKGNSLLYVKVSRGGVVTTHNLTLD